MSRVLSEKRLITVDTTSAAADTFDVGACVIDSTNDAVYVSDGATWTEIQLGVATDVTYEALNASGDVDTNISSAAANTVPSSQAVKTYVDGQVSGVPTPIPTVGGLVYSDAYNIGYTARGHEIGVITGNTNIIVNGVVGANYYHTVYNYSNNTYTITSSGGATIEDVSTKSAGAGSVDIAGGQKMVFIKKEGADDIVVYRESL